MDRVFLLHLAATCFMAGVIWFVQVVHYPLFVAFEPTTFGESMRRHQSLTSWIVMPAMLLELGTGLQMFFLAFVPGWIAAIDVVLLALTWAVTFLVSVPLHASLAHGFDAARARKLVSSNWARTALWSSRAALLVLVAGEVV